MVTHEQHAADTADRILLLDDGRIVEDRPVQTASVGLMLKLSLRSFGARKLRVALTRSRSRSAWR